MATGAAWTIGVAAVVAIAAALPGSLTNLPATPTKLHAWPEPVSGFPCGYDSVASNAVTCTFTMPQPPTVAGLATRVNTRPLALNYLPFSGRGRPAESPHEVRVHFTDTAVAILGGAPVERTGSIVVWHESLPAGHTAAVGPSPTRTFVVQQGLYDCVQECGTQNLVELGFFELLCVVALVTLAIASGGAATPLIVSTAQSCATAPLSSFLSFAACVVKCMCLGNAN